jgi:TolA-binding protein/beta-lactamase regulating signal transducer with metallopeptidase domain
MVFATAWIILKAFKIYSAFARYVIWLLVILCPIILSTIDAIFPNLETFQIENLDWKAKYEYQPNLVKNEHGKDLGIKTELIDKRSLVPLGNIQPEPESYFNRFKSWINLANLVIFAWCLGVAVNFILVLAGFIGLNRLLSNAQKINDERVIQIFNQIKEEIQITRNVQILTSDKAQTPFSFGFKQPSIILPAGILNSDEELKMVLSHELVHLKRFDDQINLVCRILLSFMFFHPLFHLAFRELAFATEQICDGWTVKLTGMRENYVNCLIELSRACIGRLPIGFGRRGSSMNRRIKAIFKDEEVFKMVSRKGMAFMTVSFILIVLIFLSVRLVGSTPMTQPISSISDTTKQINNPFNVKEYVAKDTGYMTALNAPENPQVNSGSENLRNLYEAVDKTFGEGKYREAIDGYTKILEEAKKYGDKTEDIAPGLISMVKYRIASCYAELGQQSQDPEMYKKSLEIISETYNSTKAGTIKERLLYLWGRDYKDLKQYAEAESKFGELVKEYPDSELAESAYYLLGSLYYQSKRYDSAKEAFKAVIDKFPKSSYVGDSQYYIAQCFMLEGNYNQAYEEYQRVKSDNPMLVERVKYFSCLSLMRAGRNEDAINAYQKFTTDFPNSGFMPAVYFDMASIYARLREYEKANGSYEQAILHTKDEMTKSIIQFEIGNNLYVAKDYPSALKAYQKLIEQYPKGVNISDARFMMAECLWELKDYKNALTAYTEILNDKTMNTFADKATYKIGECHYQMGNKQTALEWYQKVIDSYPDSPATKDAFYGKILTLKDLKRYDETVNIGRDFINKYKADPKYNVVSAKTQLLIGDIRFDTENYVSAVEEYQHVSSDYPDSANFDQFKCKSLLQTGLAYYKEATKNNWDPALLSKSVLAFENLLDKYEKNFDKVSRDFESRSKYVDSAKTNLEMASSRLKK